MTGAIEGYAENGWDGVLAGAAHGAWKGAVQGAQDGLITSMIMGGISGAMNPSFCFVAGTTVLTLAGKKLIEEVRAGDTIPCIDHNTGEYAEKQVISTSVNKTDKLVEIEINGEILRCTEVHPFRVKGKGWVNAVDLQEGELVYDRDWNAYPITRVTHITLSEPVEVYNFEVEDFHTYYVGNGLWLVHNACGDVGPYSQLKNSGAGKGNEIHHIIEKRFANLFNIKSTGQMPSVVLDKATHASYTSLWRQALPYGGKYSAGDVLRAAEKIYMNNSELLTWARHTVFGG